MMTCRVTVITPDGTVTQARALLDSTASTLLISEKLAKRLRLPHHQSNYKIKEVASINWCALERYCQLQGTCSWSTKWGEADRGGISLHPSQSHCRPTHFFNYQVETPFRSGVRGSRLWNSGSGGHVYYSEGRKL